MNEVIRIRITLMALKRRYIWWEPQYDVRC
jgi:hypothetical protein